MGGHHIEACSLQTTVDNILRLGHTGRFRLRGRHSTITVDKNYVY